MNYIIAILVAVAGVVGVYAYRTHQNLLQAREDLGMVRTQLDAVETALEAAKARERRLAELSLSRQKELNRLRKEAAEKQRKLDEALKANPEWSSTPVPDSVWDGITGSGPGVGGGMPHP